MDFSEEKMLVSLRDMEISHVGLNRNGEAENGWSVTRQPPLKPSIKVSLAWLDLKVFYVRVSKCVIDDDSIPEFLTLNHVPLKRDTLLEVNGTRTSIFSDGISTLLKRDRLDRKSEEVTFVSTDSIRMTGSVKFEVFHKDVLVLCGELELCHDSGFTGESKNQKQGQIWSMNCESDLLASTGFLKGNQSRGMESASPAIEVYVAGCFSGSPIILTRTLQLNHRRRQMRKGTLEAIPEYEASPSQKDGSSDHMMQVRHYENHKTESEEYSSPYAGMEYLEGEDGELSWFNAGVRVGVGIGLSICIGIGLGVGLLVRTYQGTARNFRRRLL